jgi:hypothetical protein
MSQPQSIEMPTGKYSLGNLFKALRRKVDSLPEPMTARGRTNPESTKKNKTAPVPFTRKKAGVPIKVLSLIMFLPSADGENANRQWCTTTIRAARPRRASRCTNLLLEDGNSSLPSTSQASRTACSPVPGGG